MPTLRIAALALLAVAASPRGGCDGSPYEPCAGKACGDTCRLCPPDATDCVETAEVKACDPQGVCRSAGSFSCSQDPCAGKACGEGCQPCAVDGAGHLACLPVISACDRYGQCVLPTPWLCYDPCAGKACGESCQICPPDATDCVSIQCVTACDGVGRCTCAGSELDASCSKAAACTGSGGTPAVERCCTSAPPFPNTCLVGACGCSPENSLPQSVCLCPSGECFDGARCVPR